MFKFQKLSLLFRRSGHPASLPPKKTKKIHWKKKDFIPPLADFTGVLPPPPDDELAPIDYFYSMFDKESICLLNVALVFSVATFSIYLSSFYQHLYYLLILSL